MVFTSTIFLFMFFAVTLMLYYVLGSRFSNLVLLFMSLAFYTWGEPRHIFIMVISIVVNYLLGLLIDRQQEKIMRSGLMITAVVFNLGILFYFKYFNFLIDTMNRFLTNDITVRSIALPIGISFYTFQIMSYVIDVYKKNVPVQKNILHLALYISFFPQLIAGPIVRYIDIEKQLKKRTVTVDKFYEGVIRFTCGFSKKVLLADQLAPLVDIAFGDLNNKALLCWVGIISYTLQIYYDFSGYSDMAIGMGKMFGFDFMENFNYPYVSKSIKEFWRRWHISLSTWFRDYVYIPLGGSRCNRGRQYFNLIIVFFLTGLWHGASFNFIFWGLYYVVFLIAERMGLGRLLEKIPAWMQHLYAMFVVLIGWVFFRADTLTAAVRYIKNMFTFDEGAYVNLAINMNRQYWFCILAGILLAIPHTNVLKYLRKRKGYDGLQGIAALAVFVIAICYLVGTGFSPFLYFRF